MFENICGKIKALATVVCVIGIIASVIGGIAMIAMDDDLIPTGIGTMIGGSLASWIGSFFTYGFGQLIHNTDRICKAMNCLEDDKDNTEFVVCPTCNMKTRIINGECHFCGHKFENDN